MKNSEIEGWALRVIQSVESRQSSEDSKVELKASWPSEPAKTARQIAGHANAARGERILWLIGVDEEQGVTGANYEELANWLPAVNKQFNGIPPRCYDLNVPTNYDLIVVALVFETDRAPFVVKNPAFGVQKGEPVEFEVAWREGRRTRSATRADLMLMLSDVKPLRAILGELEWNLEVASRDGIEQEQFRINEFDHAMREDALSVLSPELKSSIRSAYIAISNAQSYKHTLEMSTLYNDRVGIQSSVIRSREEAKPKIEAALIELKTYLGAT